MKVEWKPPHTPFLAEKEVLPGGKRQKEKHSGKKGVQDTTRECGWGVGSRAPLSLEGVAEARAHQP